MSDRQTLSPRLAMTAVFLGTILPSLPAITEVTSSWGTFPVSRVGKQELNYSHTRKASQKKVRNWGLKVNRMVANSPISVGAEEVMQVPPDRKERSKCVN